MKKLIMLIATFALPAAFAQTSTTTADRSFMNMEKPSLGVRLGMANMEGEEEAVEYGVEFGYQPFVPLGLAVELSGYTSDSEGPDSGLTRTKLLGKGLYNFGGTIPVIRYSYVGAGIGPVYDNVENETDWNLGFQPVAGFDIPLGQAERISLGANVAYLLVTGDNVDAVSAAGQVKYWF